VDAAEHSGGVANGGEGFSRAEEVLDQADRVRIVCKVPQGAVAAGVEHGVEVRRLHVFEARIGAETSTAPLAGVLRGIDA